MCECVECAASGVAASMYERNMLNRSLLERKESGRIPVASVRRPEAVVEEPLERLVQVHQDSGQPMALVGVHLMAEADALVDQRARQHQRVLLVDERVGGAVHQQIVAVLQVAGAHRQVGRLQGAQPLGAGRHVAVGEEGAWPKRGVFVTHMNARRLCRFRSELQGYHVYCW